MVRTWLLPSMRTPCKDYYQRTRLFRRLLSEINKSNQILAILCDMSSQCVHAGFAASELLL